MLSTTRSRSWTSLTHTAKQGTVHRLLLAKLPNGDWRNREQVQYFIGPSAEALTDHSSKPRMLETGLNHANAQLEAQAHVEGADVAVDELARIEAVHGLLTATYPRMLIAFARPSGQPQPREAPGTLSGARNREEGGKGLEARAESEDMGPADQAEAAADTTLPESSEPRYLLSV